MQDFSEESYLGMSFVHVPRAPGTAGSSLHLSTREVTRIQTQQRQESKESTSQAGGTGRAVLSLCSSPQ